MAGALRVVAGPYGEVIHRDAAKAHLNITTSDDDALVDTLIGVARGMAERYLGRPLATRTFELKLDDFPAVICLPRPSLRKLVSIAYLDDQGSAQTLDASVYEVDAADHKARAEIAPAYGQTWPSTYVQRNAVTVTFVAGWATPFTASAATDVLAARGHPYAADDLVRLSLSGGADRALPAPLAAMTDYYAAGVSGDTLQLATTAGGSAIDVTDAGTGLFLLGELPDEIRAGMLLVLSELYERREEAIVGAPIARVPVHAERLWHPHRDPVF